MKLSIVATLYYSENYVQEFYSRVVKAAETITKDLEIVFVNDGSPDESLRKVLALQAFDARVVLVDLSRNFGHHRAIMTGLQEARGDHIFLIDVDLEEAPELLIPLWQKLHEEEGTDVVYAVQEQRKGGWFEKWSGRAFYSLFAVISDIDYPADTLVARVMSRRYVEAIARYPEKELELWGIFVLAGFVQKTIAVRKGHKGSSTYTLQRKIRMAVDSITAFSSRPLRYISVLGFVMTFAALMQVFVIAWQKIFRGVAVEGWASIIASIWLVGGVIMFSIGIIGIYLSKMFLEIKNRPLTIIRQIYRK
jgi:putative glycosyltransferase